MAQTILSVRIDESVKNRFDDFCTDVGMNPSVAVNLFVKAVLKQQRIPFEISASDEFINCEASGTRLKHTSKESEIAQISMMDGVDEEE